MCKLTPQQRLIDRWRQEFNHVRPHQALDGKTPAEVYKVTERRRALRVTYSYPKHFYTGRVNANGLLVFRGDACRIGKPLAGLDVGIEVVDGLRIRVWLHDLDLGTVETLPGVDDSCFEGPGLTRTQRPSSSAVKTTRPRPQPQPDLRVASPR
jgi:putative transposase